MKLVGDDMKKDGRQYFFRKQVMIFWVVLPQGVVKTGKISRSKGD